MMLIDFKKLDRNNVPAYKNLDRRNEKQDSVVHLHTTAPLRT